ncbi:hypothetical protein JTB14_011101 [Gonioctena quinquepunctata]|nr:hypothetical protein JTB14_011101 [Gonioctena quinquepunctata]
MSGHSPRPRTPDRRPKYPLFWVLSPDQGQTRTPLSNQTYHHDLKPQAYKKTTEKNIEKRRKSQDSPILTDLFNIRNLPDYLKFQVDVYDLLTRSDVLGGNVENIKVNPNRTALIETTEPIDIDRIRRKIRHIGGFPKIEVRDLKTHREKPATSMKEFSMSYVIRDVDKNLTNEAIAKNFREVGVDFDKLWRINARARQAPTKMVRVTTYNPTSYAEKLAYGIHIYGLRHRCEKSNTLSAPLIIKYCSRCCKNGHDITKCKENFKCPFCGGDHRSSDCNKIN